MTDSWIHRFSESDSSQIRTDSWIHLVLRGLARAWGCARCGNRRMRHEGRNIKAASSAAKREAWQCTKNSHHGRHRTKTNSGEEHLGCISTRRGTRGPVPLRQFVSSSAAQSSRPKLILRIVVETFRLTLTASVMVRKLDQKLWCEIRI